MTNAELINKLRILRGAILNPHHRTGEYVDKRFADVVSDAADALEAADDRIAELIEAVANRDRLADDLNKYIWKLEAQLPKEGEWISDYDGFDYDVRCSVCGEEALIKEGGSHDHAYSHYCPNCGARMDKKEQKDE